ncbi:MULTISPECIES: glycosyltransferase family 4 protein [unclassified Acidisoma]|jgi:glycosyltransferase involved in cell wall biosynthesis|uniref:glycosyltransferase family 4 protein n=1 Tax=unclassified Acidisoma TaxID=2634065 RepID=UPI00131DC1A8|nr:MULTISPECIES: glycosyltransferase family 4 protein [unclassified Acidisoma]
MRITIFAPGSFPAATGAIVYDTRLVTALRGLGHDASLVMLAGSHPTADDTARASAAEAWHAHGDADLRIIDGFCLSAWEGLEEALSARGVIGLIHHPLALEPFQEAVKVAEYARVERRLLPLLNGILVPSQEMRNRMLSAYAVEAGRISVLMPGTDVTLPRSPREPAATCRILSVGSFIPRKGHDTLLKALSRLVDLDWHLTICGDQTADRACVVELGALRERLGLTERVTFLGALSPAQFDELWQASDLFALATWFEGYGMAVAEALRRGLPVAVTTAAAIGAPLSPDTAIIVEPGDHEQLSKALRRVIYSPELRHIMGHAAWSATRSLPSWENQARHLLDIVTPAAPTSLS